MDLNPMLQQVVAFEDMVDGYYSDKSILCSWGNSLLYYSPTGTKLNIHVDKISHNPPLLQKLTQLLTHYNQYSDVPLFCNSTLDEDECITKLTKIATCVWGSQVETTPTGFKLHSLDRVASVEVDNSLMIVRVVYLQLVNRKCLVDTFKSENVTKSLLNKYSLQYQEYPETPKVTSVAHKYLRLTKVFPISDIPPRWQYPLSLIWKHIRDKKDSWTFLIEPLNVAKNNHSTLPECVFLEQTKQENLSKLSAPMFKYPRHTTPCVWMLNLVNGEEIAWIGPQTICFDGQGVWVIHHESLHLKFQNSVESEKIYNINAIPLVVRCKGYQKSMHQFLKAVYNATQQQPSYQATELQLHPATSEDRSNKEASELQSFRTQEGEFVVYSNRIVSGKFKDRMFMIVNYNNNCVKVRDSDGKATETTLQDQFYCRYIKYMNELYQTVFYPAEKQRKERLSEESQLAISRNLSIIQHLSSEHYWQSQYADPSQTFNVEEILQRNRDVLSQLEEFK